MDNKVKAVLLFLPLLWVARNLAPANAGSQPPPTPPLNEHLAQIEALMSVGDKVDNSANAAINGITPCVNGMAGIYQCQKIDLLSNLPLSSLGGGAGADIWGWTDPLDGKEYAIFGRNNGTSFVDVSDPENPIYLGNLPPSTFPSAHWRDVKSYQNFALIVSDNAGTHGMQIFDLTRLRAITIANPALTADNVYTGGGLGSAHNVVINEDSGYAYVVGGNCGGGLHIVNIQNPLSPAFVGCYSDGYVHDAQCLNYQGPDPDYQGSEICLNFQGSNVIKIVDVTDKNNIVAVSSLNYSFQTNAYSHQGWLSEDHTLLFQGDEFDEWWDGVNTRTRIFDVSNLDNPVFVDYYDAATAAIDHNLYVHEGLLYEANYRAGLRILDSSDAGNGNLTEIAYFDTFPGSDSASFDGAWSVYPYFASETIIVSDIDRGLFVLRHNPNNADVHAPTSLTQFGAAGQLITYTFPITNAGNITDTISLSVAGNQWVTSVSPITVTVPPGVAAAITATVSIGVAGISDTAQIVATSAFDPAVQAITQLISVKNGIYLPLVAAP